MERHGAVLRGLRLKVTPKREAVLDVLSSESGYRKPEEVHALLKGRFERLGLPTVYRILEELSKGGVVTKIIHPDRQLYYCYCGESGHHHHFICLSCRRVEHITTCVLDAVSEEILRIRGKVFSHILQVDGLCSSCAGKVT